MPTGVPRCFGVVEEVAVTGADHQFRGRRPVAAEGVHRERIDRAGIGAQGIRIGGAAGVELAGGAVLAAQGAGLAEVAVIPGAEQAQRVHDAVVEAVVGVVRRYGLGQGARPGIGAGEIGDAASGIDARDVAAEDPQLVLHSAPPTS